MTGNESEGKDPDTPVFDPDNVFGSAAGSGSGADSDSPDSGSETDSIWGPFTGEAVPDHSTQVLESDAFGRPFLSEGSDPFGANDPGADPSPWPGPDSADTQSKDADSPWGAPVEPPAHMEHEVPPPWEFESGGPPAPWTPPAGEQPWQPEPNTQPGGQPPMPPAQPAQPVDNGQQPWQPQPQQPAFDPFGAGNQPDAPWSPPAPDAGPFAAEPPTFHTPGPDESPFSAPAPDAGPGESPFGTPGPDAGQGESPFGAPAAEPPTFISPGPDDSPFGGPAPGDPPGFTASAPGAEVPNPFAAVDFGAPEPAPAPFEPDQQTPGEEQQPAWQPGSEDEHSTDVLPKPGGEPAPGDGAAPWGPWPGEAGQQAPQQQPVPPQQPAQRYDLSQFQQGYQAPPMQQQGPPQAPPQAPPQPDQQIPQPFPGAPQQPDQQFQQYPGMGPGMAPPLQLPPQQPIPLTSENLSPQALLKPRKAPPTSGWRRAVFKVSGGLIDPGESSKEVQRQQMVSLVRTPVAGGHYRVAVLSLKGGVGKTTTTVGLGSTLASLRGDRIIAVDANPDRGTLSEKVRLETRANVRDLLANKENIQRYSDVRQYTSQAASRLEVLASDPDPAISEAFSEEDYRSIADVLEHYYSICLTDCGTGLLHSAMRGVLGLADQIVLVSSASVDGARSASATLDWLDAHDYGDLVQSGVVVMSAVRPQNKAVDLSRLEQHFSARCRALVRIPFDPHLEAGAEFVLEQLSAPTRDAYLELTASVAAGFQYRLPR